MPKSRIHLEASKAELTLGSPFNSGWRDCAHAVGGHWDRQRRLRVFPPEKESQVRELLANVFGDDGSAGEAGNGSSTNQDPNNPRRRSSRSNIIVPDIAATRRPTGACLSI